MNKIKLKKNKKDKEKKKEQNSKITNYSIFKSKTSNQLNYIK